MKHYIYADNAATTPLDKEAFEEMKPYLLEHYGNASQPYSFSRKGKKALQKARGIIAQCIGAEPEEIYFTSGGSESNNWAIKGLAIPFGKSKKIVTSQIEHHSVLNTCQFLQNIGYTVDYLPVNPCGVLLSDTLEKSVVNSSVVSVMLANNEIGTIQEIKDLVYIAHQQGIYFHTDAVQALGHIKVNVKDLGVDMLSASAHKFNAPKGTGFLYIKKGTPIIPLINGGLQENGMRAGTENIASVVAMAVALQNNCCDIEKNKEKLLVLENTLLNILDDNKIDYIRNGSNKHIPGNVSISIGGESGEKLLHRLDLMGICISTGSACDSRNTQISHVLKSIGLSEHYARGTIRISFGKHNTIDEAIKIGHSIVKILSSAVKMNMSTL